MYRELYKYIIPNNISVCRTFAFEILKLHEYIIIYRDISLD